MYSLMRYLVGGLLYVMTAVLLALLPCNLTITVIVETRVIKIRTAFLYVIASLQTQKFGAEALSKREGEVVRRLCDPKLFTGTAATGHLPTTVDLEGGVGVSHLLSVSRLWRLHLALAMKPLTVIPYVELGSQYTLNSWPLCSFSVCNIHKYFINRCRFHLVLRSQYLWNI